MASLASLRHRALLSQRALAKQAGVSPSSIYLIERGRTAPRPLVMRKIVDALGVADPMEVDEFRRVIEGRVDGVERDNWQPEKEAAYVPDAFSDPVLAELWDNDEDAEYDRVAAATKNRASA